MINHVVLMGRITQDLQIKYTQNGYHVLSFNVAVDKSYKQGEDRQADFITCVAWRNNAEFISKYFNKGSMIVVVGSLQTRTYEDKNGNKRKATEVVVNQSYFGESKRDSAQQAQPAVQEPSVSYSSAAASDFAVADDESDLPF